MRERRIKVYERRIIDYYRPYLKVREVCATDTFTFKQGKKPKWLHTIILWLVSKVGKQYYNYDERVEIQVINQQDLITMLLDQQGQISKLFWQEVTHIVIGYDMLKKLDIEIVSPYRIEFRRNDHPRLFGKILLIVPWMKGEQIVLLTKGLLYGR